MPNKLVPLSEKPKEIIRVSVDDFPASYDSKQWCNDIVLNGHVPIRYDLTFGDVIYRGCSPMSYPTENGFFDIGYESKETVGTVSVPVDIVSLELAEKQRRRNANTASGRIAIESHKDKP